MANIRLVSTYEGGMQPLGLATAAAHLLSAGHKVQCYDGFVTEPSPQELCDATLSAQYSFVRFS